MLIHLSSHIIVLSWSSFNQASSTHRDKAEIVVVSPKKVSGMMCSPPVVNLFLFSALETVQEQYQCARVTHNLNWSFYIIATRQSCTKIHFSNTNPTISQPGSNRPRCKFQGLITHPLRSSNSEVDVWQCFRRPQESKTCEKIELKLVLTSKTTLETLWQVTFSSF